PNSLLSGRLFVRRSLGDVFRQASHTQCSPRFVLHTIDTSYHIQTSGVIAYGSAWSCSRIETKRRGTLAFVLESYLDAIEQTRECDVKAWMCRSEVTKSLLAGCQDSRLQLRNCFVF